MSRFRHDAPPPRPAGAAALLPWAGLGGLLALLLWQAVVPAERTAPDDDDVRRGRQLVADYQCGACHVIDGVAGALGTRGPTLRQFGRRSYIAGRVPAQTAQLVQWIVEPAAVAPGTPMPSLGVAPAHAASIASFLQAQR